MSALHRGRAPGLPPARQSVSSHAQTPAHSAGATTEAGHWLELQRTVGNQAVQSLLGVRRLGLQRFPTPSADAVGGATDANLTVAERDIAQAGFLQAQFDQARAGAGGTRTADAALTPNALLEGVWRLPTSNGDLAAPLRKRHATLRSRVVSEINKLQAPLTSETALAATLANTTTRAALQTIVDGLHVSRPSFDVFEVAEDLWEHWLRLAPLESIGVDPYSASDRRKPLRAALDGMVESFADTFSGPTHGQHQRPASVTVEADPAPAEIQAVADALRPRTTWVQDADMAPVASAVAATLGRPLPDVRSALPRWVIHAERALIKEAGLAQPTAAVWAYARSAYAATLDQPVWRYYEQNIVPFEIFGRQLKAKGAGVHRAVLPTLALLDQEAMRLAGQKAVAGLAFEPGEWGGFRFEPQKADLTNKRHVSYHATGLAIDFRVQTNNVIQGQHTNLLDLIAQQGGSAVTTATIAKTDTPKSSDHTGWANTVQGHLQARDQLRARVAEITAANPPPSAPSAKVGGDSSDAQGATQGSGDGTPTTPAPVVNQELIDAQAKLATEEQWLHDVGQQGTATTLRTAGETIRMHLEEVEAAFQKSFREHFGDRAPVEEKETAAARSARITARRQALIDGWPAMRAKLVPLLSAAAKPAFDKHFPEKPAPIGALETLDPFLDRGLTDQPPWMVQAFSSLGWRWGGGWHDPIDAMHFDFMGTVPGVRN